MGYEHIAPRFAAVVTVHDFLLFGFFVCAWEEGSCFNFFIAFSKSFSAGVGSASRFRSYFKYQAPCARKQNYFQVYISSPSARISSFSAIDAGALKVFPLIIP